MPWKLSSEYTFDSAHLIEGYDGPCGRLHGHTYRLRVEVSCDKLRASEFVKRAIMVADFRTLKWAKKDVSQGGLDHMYLNDIPELGGDTTAEMIAAYIYRETYKRIQASLPKGEAMDELKLHITLWETPTSCCEYWE